MTESTNISSTQPRDHALITKASFACMISIMLCAMALAWSPGSGGFGEELHDFFSGELVKGWPGFTVAMGLFGWGAYQATEKPYMFLLKGIGAAGIWFADRLAAGIGFVLM